MDYNESVTSVTLQELQRDPLGLLLRVEAGESITVTRGEVPVAELRPVPHSRGDRPYGLDAGQFMVPDDFDAPLPDDLIRTFEGR